MNEPAVSNIVEFSVSELAGALKVAIEDQFGYVRVRGEISGYRGPHGSGHVYFSIKDANAKIDAVIWRGVFARMRVKPQDGMEVVASGKITTFPGKSSYQILVERIEPAGVGALMALLEDRRRRLAAEGLFDAARKQLIPYLPETVGVITSPSGAVIRDIIHRIADRFPRRVLIWPVRVQGETSAGEIVAALAGFNGLSRRGPVPRPDVLILARGGGSLEDLLSFNDEGVVRAAADSDIPLIAAVGHETDWTLVDFAADLRAPTPTGAAEMCVPVRSELLHKVSDIGRRLMAAGLRDLKRRRSDLRAAGRLLPSPDELIGVPRQRFDRAAERSPALLSNLLTRRRGTLLALAARLQPYAPQARLARLSERLSAISARLALAPKIGLGRCRRRQEIVTARFDGLLRGRIHFGRDQRQRMSELARRLSGAVAAQLRGQRAISDGLGKLLVTLGYRQVLARGFVLIRDVSGRPLRLASQVVAEQRLDLEFSDGHVDAIAAAARPSAAPPRRPARQRDQGQGQLF
jgi:exodeoxyribonuclease VII large subunit